MMSDRLRRFSVTTILVMLLAFPCPAPAGFFSRLATSSHPWHFNGREFVPGPDEGGVVIQVRDGYLPVMPRTAEELPSAVLPEGRGAVAGFCYLQISGGKRVDNQGVEPSRAFPLEISGDGVPPRAVVTDERGFFILSLPAGDYQVRGAGNPVRITVKAGKTSLTAIRTGKRMAD